MSAHKEQETAARPNILFILTDDQGPWALGRETPEIITPTLDRLADEGTYFSRFFCASPVCSPARASILTGRMPSAHGIHDWIQPCGIKKPQPPGSYLDGMETIPQMLSRSGYTCGMSGKWHVGYSHEPAPGFDYWYVHRLGGSTYYDAPIWEFDETTGRTTSEPKEVPEPRYFTDAVGDHALDFLRRYQESGTEQPFFLEVATTAPHDPWTNGNHPPELLALYDDTDFPNVPQPPAHPWFKPKPFAGAIADRHSHLAGYAAAITGVDRMVERIITDLEDRGLLDSTIIIFTADNGFSCGQHGIWGKGNGTYPQNFWENSVRVPFIIWGPGVIASGRVVDHLVSATSLYETIAELTGSQPGPDPLRAGRSVAALLQEGETPPHGDPEQPVVVHDEYGGGRMIRDARWKLVVRREGPGELYDLDHDPDEENNLYGDPAHAERQAQMEEKLKDFFAHHTDAGLDGWELPVRGSGQLGPILPGQATGKAPTELFDK